MTQARIAGKNQVSLNGVVYKTTGPVQQRLMSQFAPKFVTGDINKDSHTRHSIWAPRFMEGIGKYKVRPGEPSNRAWWSTHQLRYDGHLPLPQLATTTAASGVTGSYNVGAIGELANEIYAAFGTAVRKYNNTTDSWGSTLATLPAIATDSITFRLNNVVYLAFATTGGYTYTSDGSAWTDDTKDTLYMAYWDDRLWGIDNTGLLWWSSQIGSEQDNAQIPLPNGSVTNLFVASNAAGVEVLYAGTTNGLYVHLDETTKWLFTKVSLPYHPDNGKGAVEWRDSIYISAGLGIERLTQGNGNAIITIVGPDKDDGLPSDKRGVIRQLVPSHNDLLAVTDGTTAPGALTSFPTRGASNHHGVVIDPDVGYSTILGWNEKAGWECKWLGGSAEQAISWAHVSNAYSTYRLWWAQNQRIYFMPLQRDIVNPTEVTTLTYAATTQELITPWLDPGQDVDSLALSLKVETATTTSNETVTVDYAINYSTTYTSFTSPSGVITTNGVTEFPFPTDTAPTGTAFRSIRFRVRTVRGSTTTLTPDVLSIIFMYQKKMPAKYIFEVDIDLQKDGPGGTIKEQRNTLRTALESTVLVQFTYRNDTSTDLGSGDRRYYVNVESATNMEETGEDESGVSRVVMGEG